MKEFHKCSRHLTYAQGRPTCINPKDAAQFLLTTPKKRPKLAIRGNEVDISLGKSVTVQCWRTTKEDDKPREVWGPTSSPQLLQGMEAFIHLPASQTLCWHPHMAPLREDGLLIWLLQVLYLHWATFTAGCVCCASKVYILKQISLWFSTHVVSTSRQDMASRGPQWTFLQA